ncbi:MAG: polysaccharide biosynthesis protein, partial [Egibacteraceae bacterium]
MGVDGLAWTGGLAFATLTRMGIAESVVNWQGLAVVAALAVSLQVAGGILSKLYLGRRKYGSFDEIAVLAPTAAGVTAVLLLVVAAAGSPRLVPYMGVLAGGLAAFVGMGASRYAWRLYIERRLRPDVGRATHLLVFGAGEGAEQVITAMLRNPLSPYLPVGLLDDDPKQRHLEVRCVPVVGTRADIAAAAEEHDAEALLIAIPSASGELIREISELAHQAHLPVKVLPPVSELIDATITVSDIRPLTDADLLGRHDSTTDLDGIADYLTGRRVLVTGAGGSIGAELCRQLQRFAPGELIML